MSDTIEHKCPSCGATVTFDAGSQKVVCGYCGCSYDPSDFIPADKDIKLDAESIELPMNGGEEWSDEDDVSEYHCNSCGGEVYTESTTSATICPFCGSTVILKGRLKGSLMPDRVIPFKITKEEALRDLDAFIRKKHFVQKGFIDERELEESKGLYVPFWVYDLELDADLEYTCMKEKVLVPGKNSDVVEQRFFKVTRQGSISFDKVPADGSSKMPDDLMESLEPFDSGESVDFTTAYLSGYIADKYDITQEDVVPRIRQRVCEETDDRFRKTIEGYDRISMSESSINAEKSEVDYVLYPVWLFNLRWNDQKFTFAVNGQTGKIAGDLPPNKGRILITSLLFFAILMAGAWLLFSPGAPMDEIIDAMTFSTLICGIFAGTLYSMLLASLKSVERKHGSEDYYREGSMNISDRSEEFLYKKITTR